jgi:hypothetical protein
MKISAQKARFIGEQRRFPPANVAVFEAYLIAPTGLGGTARGTTMETITLPSMKCRDHRRSALGRGPAKLTSYCPPLSRVAAQYLARKT